MPAPISVSLVVLVPVPVALSVKGAGEDQRSDQSERERSARPGESGTGHYRSLDDRFFVELPVVVGVGVVVDPV